MPQARWYLILNGKSAGNHALREAVAGWRKRGIELSVRVTWETGDAARYVDEAIAAGADSVIAAGGDGTLGEVAAALAGHGEPAEAVPALGLVPLGTANDFATAAGVPEPPHEALALVATRPPVAIDLLQVQADDAMHWCINLASGGFGTQVTVETDDGLKKMLGGLAYLVTGLARLGRIEPIRARVEGPDFAWHGDFIALGIGNGRQAGGGQMLCPDALLDDGLLDLTVIPDLVGEVSGTLGALISGGKAAALDRLAVQARLPWLRIEAERPLTLNLDGEPEKARLFHIQCVARRLRMHLPPACALLSR